MAQLFMPKARSPLLSTLGHLDWSIPGLTSTDQTRINQDSDPGQQTKANICLILTWSETMPEVDNGLSYPTLYSDWWFA